MPKVDDANSEYNILYDDKVNPIKRCIFKYIPVLRWISRSCLTSGNFMFDVIAGISVGLTIIPMSTAFADLAGVSVDVGLRTSVAGFLMYALLGTVKEIFIGPSSVLSIITSELTYNMNDDFVILLTFLAGLVQMLMGLTGAGFVVSYISIPVVSGFINAVTINIVSAGMPGLLGLQFRADGFIDRVTKTCVSIRSSRYWSDLPLGVTCIGVLIGLHALSLIKINTDNWKKLVLQKTITFVSVSRNAVVILLATSATAYFHSRSEVPFIVVGKVRPGLPTIALPLHETKIGNVTYGVLGMIGELNIAIVILPFMSALFTNTIARSHREGKHIEFNQEFIAIGSGNFVGSFIGAMPASGAMISGSVASTCGVRSPLAGIYTAILALLVMTYLSPFMSLIPKASLSAVLIYSVITRFDLKTAYPLWKTDKVNFVIMVLTILLTLGKSLTFGLLSGILLSVLYLLYLWARPKITVEIHSTQNGDYCEITPDKGMYFPAVDTIREIVVENRKHKCPIVINCIHFSGIDFTALKCFVLLTNDVKSFGQHLILYNCPQHLVDNARRVPMFDKIKFCQNDNELELTIKMPV